MRSLIRSVLILLVVACQPAESLESDQLRVVCTTGMAGDAVKNLLGEEVELRVLMGPGVDPHLYKATQGDIEALTRADIIVYNGLHLEGKMTDILHKLQSNKKVYAIGELLAPERLINSTDFQGAYDPHIWFDVALWNTGVEALADALARDFPQRASTINKNREIYSAILKELDEEVRQGIATIPEGQRVLITAHDAFKYFGRAYGIEVKGLQGISTASEYGLRDVSDLVNFVTDNNIRAIFVESSVPRRSVEAVMEGASERGHDLELGGELYSDAMGDADSPEGNYPGMVRYNLNTIVNALR